MIIYQIDLFIKNEVFNEFNNWLSTHIHQMLQFNGFESASIYCKHPDSEITLGQNAQIPKNSNEETQLTVHYRVNTIEDLQYYLANHAMLMRQQGFDKFNDKFRAERKVLNIL